MLSQQMRWIANTERDETIARLEARAAAEDVEAIATLARVKNGSLLLSVVPDDPADPSITEERRAALLGRLEVRARFEALPQSPLPLISYAYGVDVGNNFGPGASSRNWDLQTEVLCNALRARLRAEPMILTTHQYDEVIEFMRDDYRALIFRRKYQHELLKTHRWFADNVERDNVFTDGKLQYEIIKRGSVTTSGGRRPTPNDRVRIHYRLMQRDLTVIETNFHKEAKLVGMQDVVPAWHMALLQMLPGDRWKLYQHPDLAFGAAGYLRKVKPGGSSICELELVEVVGGQQAIGANRSEL
jgi:peptidylprolyl isomerase